MNDLQALRSAFEPYAVRFGEKSASETLPGGANDIFHSVDLIKEYGAWIQARALQMDAYFNSLDGVNLSEIRQAMHTADPTTAVALGIKLGKSKNPKAALVAPKWITWRDGWDTYYAALQSDLNTWKGWILYVPVVQLFNPLTEAWDSLRAQHAGLLAVRDELVAAKAVGVPPIAQVPRAGVSWKDAVDTLGKVADKAQETLNLALVAVAVVGGFLLLKELKG